MAFSFLNFERRTEHWVKEITILTLLLLSEKKYYTPKDQSGVPSINWCSVAFRIGLTDRMSPTVPWIFTQNKWLLHHVALTLRKTNTLRSHKYNSQYTKRSCTQRYSSGLIFGTPQSQRLKGILQRTLLGVEMVNQSMNQILYRSCLVCTSYFSGGWHWTLIYWRI